jgi:nicotinate-nucleotide pyrophosphorylase (carboxylating)
MTTTPPDMLRLADYVTDQTLRGLIETARAEDFARPGQRPRDITSELVIATDRHGEAVFRARTAGRLSGAASLPMIVDVFDPAVALMLLLRDGSCLQPGSEIARIEGPLRSILALERTALNLMTHLSGIASLTALYVDAVAGTRARIHDTRKTLPGLRGLQKYAVACGGGGNHRMGLHDAVLVKDNHIAHVPAAKLGYALRELAARARAADPPATFVEVEVDTLEQLAVVLPCGVDVVLLDNMPPATLREAVAMRDRLVPAVKLEASGGVNLQTVRAIAEAGVDIISVGALTHSAPALDIGLDMN